MVIDDGYATVHRGRRLSGLPRCRLADSEIDKEFRWGLTATGDGRDTWGIPTKGNVTDLIDRHRTSTLRVHG